VTQDQIATQDQTAEVKAQDLTQRAAAVKNKTFKSKATMDTSMPEILEEVSWTENTREFHQNTLPLDQMIFS